MPRKLKKMEMPEATPSRQESVPGPSVDTKKKAAALARQALERYKAKEEAADRSEMEADLDMLEPKAYEEEQVAKTVAKMAERDVKESRAKKRKQETELQGMVKELVEESGVEMPAMKEEVLSEKPEKQLRKEMEDLDREWAERIKKDIEATEAKTAELQKKNLAKAEMMQSVREKSRAALETYKKEVLPKQELAEAGEEIAAGMRAERKAAEMDPARKRAANKLKKLEAEQDATAQRLRDLTGMEPEDAYEKLVLNAGFMGRIRRGLAGLANVPTYGLLDAWFEKGKEIETVSAEVYGSKVQPEHEFKVRGKKMMKREPDEDDVAEAIEADYKQGIVRDAEGNVIEDEKKVRAKRPMSRVGMRKVSMTAGGTVEEAMSKGGRVELYQGEGSSTELPPVAETVKPAEAVEEDPFIEYQKERAADINVVRKEYPRAAEIWNSINARLQSMEQIALLDLSEVFGTRDIATAYTLDRAFYDMDGDQEAKARLAKADKLMGIEEVSPKKVRAKPAKKAA